MRFHRRSPVTSILSRLLQRKPIGERGVDEQRQPLGEEGGRVPGHGFLSFGMFSIPMGIRFRGALRPLDFNCSRIA